MLNIQRGSTISRGHNAVSQSVYGPSVSDIRKIEIQKSASPESTVRDEKRPEKKEENSEDENERVA